MRVKCIRQKRITQKQFLLLMITPLFIGILITLTSLAHGEWNKNDDPLLLHSPQKQGWAEVGKKEFSSSTLTSKKLIKIASM